MISVVTVVRDMLLPLLLTDTRTVSIDETAEGPARRDSRRICRSR